MIRRLINWLFGKKDTLRDRCVKIYGEDFGKIYDDLNSGIPIDGLIETMAVLRMIEDVKNGKIKEGEIDVETR